MRVHLLRHGESRSNADPERIAIPDHEGDALSDRGREQAETAAAAPRVTEHPLVFRDPANSRRLAKSVT